MSPEQLLKQNYRFEPDIWSLGVVVYAMRFLQHPFDDSDSYKIGYNVINKDPELAMEWTLRSYKQKIKLCWKQYSEQVKKVWKDYKDPIYVLNIAMMRTSEKAKKRKEELVVQVIKLMLEKDMNVRPSLDGIK